jgi:ribosomal protein L16 Arg81 hydroxylase
MIDLGLNRSEFRGTFFEKQPLLRRSCFDSSPFSWRTIDEALDLQDPTPELLKILRGGRVDPASYVEEYVDIGLRRRRILKDRLYAHLEAGATLVLNRIELVSPRIREVCMEIGRLVGAQTTSNAYASFGPEAATNAHWDTHDVFIVQVRGRKHWRLYEPTHPLPISSQISNDRKAEMPRTPSLDTILAAGDVLYVPRGWWHRVTPIPEHDTIHLTVAVHTPLILDLLVWACATVLPHLIETRHSLLGDAEDSDRLSAAVAAASETLLHPATLQAFYARSRQRERVVSPFLVDPLLTQPHQTLPHDAKFRLNARYANGRESEIFINGQPFISRDQKKAVVQQLADAVNLDINELKAALPTLGQAEIIETLTALLRDDVIQIASNETHTRKQFKAA